MRSPRFERIGTAAALLALALPPADALAQCAMCATAAAGNKVARGLAFSIAFMLTSLSLGVLGLVAVVVRRARHRDHDRGAPPPE